MSITVSLGLWYLACFAYAVGLAMHRGTTVWRVLGGVGHEWIRGWRRVLAAFAPRATVSRPVLSAARIRELERELGFDLEVGRDC